ncbi:MAG TPA: DMT family transporter [Candidatus Limnocylindrales bacterium]|nr:DMT family transporter [Candidatus Limnocylindrales bacterium]
MSIGLELGLIAAVCWGSTDVSAAIAGRRLGSLGVTAIVQATSLAAILALCLVRGSWFPTKIEDVVVAVVTGVVAAGAYVSFFTALRIGPLSVVSPVVAAYGGLTVILAVLVRGETLTSLQAVGAALATLGVILTGLVSDGGWRNTKVAGKGVGFAIVALVCFAILTIGLAGPIRSAGWLPVLLTARIANAATVALVMLVVMVFRPRAAAPLLAQATDRPPGRLPTAVLAAIAGGALDIAGFVAFAFGLEQAPAWILGLASSFGPVVSVVVAVVLWGERLQPSQWIGLAGIGLGLVAVALP